MENEKQRKIMRRFLKSYLVLLPLVLALFFVTKQYFYGVGLLILSPLLIWSGSKAVGGNL